MLQLNTSVLEKKIIYLSKNRGFKELEIIIDIWLKTILYNADINGLELIVKTLQLDDYQLYGILTNANKNADIYSLADLSQLYSSAKSSH